MSASTSPRASSSTPNGCEMPPVCPDRVHSCTNMDRPPAADPSRLGSNPSRSRPPHASLAGKSKAFRQGGRNPCVPGMAFLMRWRKILNPGPSVGISIHMTCKLLILFPSPGGRGVRGEGRNLCNIKRLASTLTPSAFWRRVCAATDAPHGICHSQFCAMACAVVGLHKPTLSGVEGTATGVLMVKPTAAALTPSDERGSLAHPARLPMVGRESCMYQQQTITLPFKPVTSPA